MRKHLTTYDDVIRRLGGVPEVARLCGCGTQAVWNWRARGFFPTANYWVMVDELTERGFTAERRLWRFKERVQYRARDKHRAA